MITTILVVEDEPVVLATVRIILEAGGYEVLTATSGTQALAVSRNLGRPIHLLLSDVMLPGMLGPELATILRQERPGLRVIMMSGKQEGVLEVMDKGWKFLKKPFLASALVAKVQAELERPARGPGNAANAVIAALPALPCPQ